MNRAASQKNNEVWFVNGKPSAQSARWFSALDRFYGKVVQGVFPSVVYVNLADINDRYPNPDKGDTLMTEKGSAVFNGTIWVKSSDYSTPIT